MATLKTITRSGQQSWQLSWHDELGQHRKIIGRVGVMSTREANAILKAKEYELASRNRVLNMGEDGGRVASVQDALAEYLLWASGEHSPATLVNKKSVLCNQLASVEKRPLPALSAAWFEQWRRDHMHFKSTSIAQYFRLFIAFLNWCEARGYRMADDAHLVKLPRVVDARPPRFYSEGELQQLYDCARNDRWRAICKLLANTGMRRTEAVQLRWSDVHNNALHIVSSQNARTKTGKWRSIPLSPGAQQALETLRACKQGTHVIGDITAEALTNEFKACAKRAGLDGSPHTMRHTFASMLVMKGVPLSTVQQLLGHATIEMTQKYAHLCPQHVAAATATLDL